MRLLGLYAREGDQGAFSTLVSRHMGWVYSACKRGLRDRHLAEDVFQSVMVAAISKRDEIEDREHRNHKSIEIEYG